ncbi:4-alpha-glucanotransferase [Corynebacterium doosanense]|uniref:4-alpha-glucanotransferase n=1 Tax=Corynebacterium doosanense CAU 212 = DSM 45436 TaxID=558173 RepID=A0A097IHJ2_9CORY|nr:4-alpha-glucanotransferase [Corynebacterium doosanense]AIT61594.1 4-alpha-glucanotransferase [Corynebacterium doosanense CAU 212 = DSM 45436]
MTYMDKLRDLADDYAISTEYTDNSGNTVSASQDTLLKLLIALGAPLSEGADEQELTEALRRRRQRAATRPLPPTVVSTESVETGFLVHVHDGAPANVHIELEDGGTREVYQDENWTEPVTVDGVTWGEASFHIPGDLPRGYHRLILDSDDLHAEAALIITPARLETTASYLSDPRFGVMAQLYSVRSSGSWGIGDFHDMGELAATLATTIGADFLQVNPLHAAEPFPPVENSPYLPSTRRFTNPLYLRVEDVPEYTQLAASARAEIAEIAEELGQANTSADKIERNPIYQAKLDSLREMFSVEFTPERREAFEAYQREEGEGLAAFAEWCADRELEQVWAKRRHAITPAREDLAEFHRWLQFLCDEQMGHAQQRATEAGMAIGIMTDLAVGVHPGGADAHTMSDWLVQDASVGAPPDPYNQQGQDWSQPPWNPEALAEEGYAPWREMLSSVLRHSGGIRVDHILGLFRLFWMPRMEDPSTGTYVRYDHEAMVGVLALEAERADAVVIGEDLGTFEPWVQDVLADRGVMGTTVLWFESDDNDEPLAASDYRRLSLSSVGTHDLPPTAGYLEGEHIRLRDELGVLTTDAEEEEKEDVEWQSKVLNRLSKDGYLAGTAAERTDFTGLGRDERGETADLLVGLHRFIAATPSALTVTNLVDLVGDRRVQNQPGTNADVYPNWCIPLCDGNGDAVLIDDLADLELVRRVGEASRR